MTQHEPKEPRRAPTREEFAALIGTYEAQAYDHGYCEGCASYDDEGLSGAKRTAERAKSRAKATGAALLAAFDALAAERDEWKRWAELEAVSAYDLLARAAKAEAERDAARALVRDLRDPSPCDHFDHHGHCQTHGWMETDPPCPHGRATKLLEALGEK